jgi:hypothetical protein
MAVREVNIKAAMPTVAEAKKKLHNELILAKRTGVCGLKIIHGYGSSGEGGALRPALRQALALRKKEGRIRDFVPGERWGIFDETSRRMLDACPDLSRDSDLNRRNNGVTIVLL